MKKVTLFLLSSDRGDSQCSGIDLPRRPLCGNTATSHLVQAAVNAGVQDIRVLISPEEDLCPDAKRFETLDAMLAGSREEHVLTLSTAHTCITSDTLVSLVAHTRRNELSITQALDTDAHPLLLCCWQKEAFKNATPTTSDDLFANHCPDTLKIPDKTETCKITDLSTWSKANHILQQRILNSHMQNGVQIIDPHSTYIEKQVTIGAGTVIFPFTVIMNGVNVGEKCELGPFSHLRKGAVMKNSSEVGNFTEMKNSTLGEHSKAKHLSYLGDTTIGQKVNIGAGTITANYDGINKHKTEIMDNAFIGSGSILVAPLKIGNGAITGAGSVVLKNKHVGSGELVVGVPAKPMSKRKD